MARMQFFRELVDFGELGLAHDLRVEHRVELLDVTGLGDAHRQYTRGPSALLIEADFDHPCGLETGPASLGLRVDLDLILESSRARITGPFFVTKVETVGGLVTRMLMTTVGFQSAGPASVQQNIDVHSAKLRRAVSKVRKDHAAASPVAVAGD